jgi:hypothetical protein
MIPARLDRLIRAAVIQWTIWRGRRKQDRRKPRPSSPRLIWRWTADEWEAGIRYAPTPPPEQMIWTRFFGLRIDWRGRRLRPLDIPVLVLAPWTAAAIFKLVLALPDSYLAMVGKLYSSIALFLFGAGVLAALAWCWRRLMAWRTRRYWRRRHARFPSRPAPLHPNCRCAVVPMSAVTTFDEEPK